MASKKCCSCCSMFIISLCVALIGITFVGISFGAQPLYKHLVLKKLVMKKGSMTFDDWQHAPLPIYMNYYVFNYTNVEDVLKQGAKPNLTEVGPYAYREDRINEILEMNADEITYKQKYTYRFDANMSCQGCQESDMIYTPNIPYQGIMKILSKANTTTPSQKIIMNTLGKIFDAALTQTKSGIFYHHNISQLLWGYKDNFLDQIQKNSGQLPPQWFLSLNISFPNNLNTFIQLQHNGTDEADFFGNLTLKTGNENIDDLQQIVKWRNSKEVPCWLTKFGRMINGTDGTHFKPFLSEDDKLYTFIPDICRSVYLVYDKKDSVQNIDLYRFTTDGYSMLNASKNPDNNAFCVGGCGPDGIIPIGQCQDGDPPVYASGVHFYQSAQSLFDAVDGLEPSSKEKHATLISIEPDTGTTMKANKRIQINVKAVRVSNITSTYGFPEDGIYLPVMFADEAFKLDGKNADTFKENVSTPRKYLRIFRFVLIGVGGFLVLFAILLYAWYSIKGKRVTNGFKKM